MVQGIVCDGRAFAENAFTVGEVAARCHLSESALRMWEQRYGFPRPQRDPAGKRRYSTAQLREIHEVLELRDAGLSLPTAIDRIRACEAPGRHSLSAELRALGARRPLVVGRAALHALNHAVFDECLMRGEPAVVVAGMGGCAAADTESERWRQVAAAARLAIAFGDFPTSREHPGGWLEVATDPSGPFSRDVFAVAQTPTFAMAVSGWRRPGGHEPSFEVTWSLAPGLAHRALVYALARAAVEVHGRVDWVLAELATREPAALPLDESATERIIEYLAVASAGRPA